jgi:hypothetical protein
LDDAVFRPSAGALFVFLLRDAEQDDGGDAKVT